MRKLLALIAVIALVAALFFALGDREEAGVSGEAETPQVLRRGNGAEPSTLDPARADETHEFNILVDLYEGLMALDAGGSLIPGVAETYDISDDGLTYTFTLRADAKWSNGDPVVAEDFVRALRRVTDPETASSFALQLSPIQNFEAVRSEDVDPSQLGVSATDDRTLVITLDNPTGHFLSLLSTPVTYPIHASSTADTLDDPETFIGNGAYVLSERQTLGVIRLSRNEHYWDSANVAIEEVEYFPINDETAEMNMYRSGGLDITHAIPSASVEMLRQTIPDEVRIAPRSTFYYYGFDMTQPPLDDVNLRRALTMAIDRPRLAKAIGRGEVPAYHYVPPGTTNHVPAPYEWQDWSDADRIAAARAAYRQAGYGDDNPLTLSLMFNSGSVHERIAVVVQSMWEEALGVQVELDKREMGVMLGLRAQRDAWEVMRLSWGADYNDPLSILEIFHSESDQNLAMYASEDFDEFLEQATIEIDPARRLELMTAAEETVLNGYPVAPLYFYVSKHLVKPNVGGFEHNAINRHPSRFLTLDAGD